MKFILLLIMITACSSLENSTSIPTDDSTSSNLGIEGAAGRFK